MDKAEIIIIISQLLSGYTLAEKDKNSNMNKLRKSLLFFLLIATKNYK